MWACFWQVAGCIMSHTARPLLAPCLHIKVPQRLKERWLVSYARTQHAGA